MVDLIFQIFDLLTISPVVHIIHSALMTQHDNDSQDKEQSTDTANNPVPPNDGVVGQPETEEGNQEDNTNNQKPKTRAAHPRHLETIITSSLLRMKFFIFE